MNKNAIVMAAVVLVVAAGTYYGLEMIAGKPKPGVSEVAEAPEAVVPVEEAVIPESPDVPDDVVIEGADEMPLPPDMTADVPPAGEAPPMDVAPPADETVPVETPAAPPPEVVAEPVEAPPVPEAESESAAMPEEPASDDAYSDADTGMTGMESDPYAPADSSADMTPESDAEDPTAIAARAAEQAARVAAEQAAREAARQAVEEALQQQNQ